MADYFSPLGCKTFFPPVVFMHEQNMKKPIFHSLFVASSKSLLVWVVGIVELRIFPMVVVLQVRNKYLTTLRVPHKCHSDLSNLEALISIHCACFV